MTVPLYQGCRSYLALLLWVLPAACGFSSSTNSGAGGAGGIIAGNGGNDVAGAGGLGISLPRDTVGTSGGTITEEGLSLEIPPGALTADTTFTIATIFTQPAGYTISSGVYQIGPPGLTFLQPVEIQITLNLPLQDAHLFWSNASGSFDDLGGTVTNSSLSGEITHLGTGFVAVLPGTTSFSGTAPAGWDLSKLKAYIVVGVGGSSYAIEFADEAFICLEHGCPGTHSFGLDWARPSFTAPPVGNYSASVPSASSDNVGLLLPYEWDSSCAGGLPAGVGATSTYGADLTVASSDATSLSGSLMFHWSSNAGNVSFGGTFTAMLAPSVSPTPTCTNPLTVCTCN
jgi:hypothetical protein